MNHRHAASQPSNIPPRAEELAHDVWSSSIAVPPLAAARELDPDHQGSIWIFGRTCWDVIRLKRVIGLGLVPVTRLRHTKPEAGSDVWWGQGFVPAWSLARLLGWRRSA